MKSVVMPPRRTHRFPLAVLPLLAALLCLCGCGDVEDTNTASARSTLGPAASFSVVQKPPSSASTNVVATNVVDGVTNVVTTVISGTPSITSLKISATADGDAWTVQADDSAGGSHHGTATGPSLRDPGSGNAYAAGSTIATFSLQCANLSGEIVVAALVPIPLEVVRTSSTNGTHVVTSRHGQHSISSQNAQYRLSATLSRGGASYKLSGTAPAPAATIVW